MPISLFQDLKLGGFHSSISTTYSVDPAFYDSTIQYKLRVNGCRNNILLADQGMLTRALTSTPEAFQKAGLDYVVKGFSHSRSFHPKIFARYGKNKARIIIGSANATCAGWGRNLEVLSAISWKKNSDSQNNMVYRGLVSKTHNYLMGLIVNDDNENLAYKYRLLHKESPWLNDYDPKNSFSELEDGTLVDVLFGFPGHSVSLFKQFVSKIVDPATSISIVSPYWDNDLTTVKNLWSKFGERPIKVWVNARDSEISRSQFPKNSLDEKMPIEFFQTPETVAGRFPHAKIICIHTANHDHILFGSANCTFAALGNEERPGFNDEACFYRRVTKNTLYEHLGLNDDNPIDLSRIETVDSDNQETQIDTHFDPGSLQLFRQKIIWVPNKEIIVKGSKILIDGEAHKVTASSESSGFAYVNPEIITSTIVGIVVTADGRQSRPVIIEVPDLLKNAAPSSIQKGLQDKLNAVISGESDLMNLARDIHLIFVRDPDSVSVSLSSGRKVKPASASQIGIDYDSPEAFREALSVSNRMNRDDLSHADNPALQAILKIVLRGLINFADPDSQEAARKAEVDALEKGDFDDGSDHEDGDEYSGVEKSVEHMVDGADEWDGRMSVVQFEKNQFYLLKFIEELESQIDEFIEDPTKFDSDFITQILFVFYLMMYGCTHKYKIDKGGDQTLIAFGFSNLNDRSNIFLIRASRMIMKLWGDKWERNLFRHMRVDANLSNLPIPLFTLIVLSRWIMASILVEVESKKQYAALEKILKTQVPKIFANTFCFSIHENEMVEIVTEIQNRVVSDKLFGDKVLIKLKSMTTEFELKKNS